MPSTAPSSLGSAGGSSISSPSAPRRAGCDLRGTPRLAADDLTASYRRLRLRDHEAPRAIAKLLAYLRQDYACLGYPLPSAARAPS